MILKLWNEEGESTGETGGRETERKSTPHVVARQVKDSGERKDARGGDTREGGHGEEHQ